MFLRRLKSLFWFLGRFGDNRLPCRSMVVRCSWRIKSAFWKKEFGISCWWPEKRSKRRHSRHFEIANKRFDCQFESFAPLLEFFCDFWTSPESFLSPSQLTWLQITRLPFRNLEDSCWPKWSHTASAPPSHYKGRTCSTNWITGHSLVNQLDKDSGVSKMKRPSLFFLIFIFFLWSFYALDSKLTWNNFFCFYKMLEFVVCNFIQLLLRVNQKCKAPQWKQPMALLCSVAPMVGPVISRHGALILLSFSSNFSQVILQ